MGSKRKSFPKVLHMQSHGREIHATCFVSLSLGSKRQKSKELWVASGSEDGTVRVTRYSSLMIDHLDIILILFVIIHIFNQAWFASILMPCSP